LGDQREAGFVAERGKDPRARLWFGENAITVFV
jgi:hypothetical protein